ncbi:hypothetical protein ACGFYT_12190 [Streptomyces sp. NPDC048208]|uniref:hypothetical protein n=1 Tax=Streptomyces sp. NPDC048208 TaxID=3365515 RepID=UPI00371D3618
MIRFWVTHARSTSYDANPNQLTAVNAQGTGARNATTYGWDSSDNLTCEAAHRRHHGARRLQHPRRGQPGHPSGKKTSYSYDNQLTALTIGGTTSRYTYAGTDSSNRLTADSTRIDQSDPSGQEQNRFLSAAGDPVKHVTNASGLIAAASFAGPWGTGAAALEDVR